MVVPHSRSGNDGSKMGAVRLVWGKEAQSGLLGPWRGPVEYLTQWPKCKSPGIIVWLHLTQLPPKC